VNKAKRKASTAANNVASIVSHRASHRAFSLFQPNMPEARSQNSDASSQVPSLQVTPTDLLVAFAPEGFAFPLPASAPELLSFGTTDPSTRGEFFIYFLFLSHF
jgi:hypothetical protein